MGAKSSKLNGEPPSPSKCCQLVYGPELTDYTIENDWSLECTVQVDESADCTFFGVIGWKSGGYCGIQVS